MTASPLTLSFSSAIEFIFQKIKNREKFAFSKYADGEYKVLVNESITNCDGWSFSPFHHSEEHSLLLESFKYNHPDYIVGISCTCCQPLDHVKWMKENVGTEKVTWANIFVNSNYTFFVENFLPEFNSWEGRVVVVANEKGKDKELPFPIHIYEPIKIGSWLNPELRTIVDKMKKVAAEMDGQLFLFSAGPLGNILAYLLHLVNPNNTYLDIGSTINPWIVGNNRRYLRESKNKTCRWL